MKSLTSKNLANKIKHKNNLTICLTPIIYNNSQNLNGGIKKELKSLEIDSPIESNIDGFCLSDVSSFELEVIAIQRMIL